ncbi:hypothetical protein ARMSODRAFT_900281 [Armillaria solidipes]|uniref:Heterokaryon incompatibility domain-containing protein n=1 Tax=Armillaria solidipes TaxID=1076256 RepID=A0A2H3AXX8_9AGAR|nr:hypothetical protein ARMSODRAFT_900281 [Armillaria solidipes]
MKDRKRRQDALVGNKIVDMNIPPRRVWDLYSNQVLPWWIIIQVAFPISHAWVDEKDRVNVWTPINGYEWPVPIPNDADLDLIRIEMLNTGVHYVWLDILCLRQKGGTREDLRPDEWKLDVPTIGGLYRGTNRIIYYLSGLGHPLSFMAGDFESDRCWFRRAWTLQETHRTMTICGDTGLVGQEEFCVVACVAAWLRGRQRG